MAARENVKKKLIFIIFLFFTLTSFVFPRNENAYPFTSSKDAERFDTLLQETRCLVCQNQSIADSDAPLASDLRGKIYEMVLEKKSDEEIESYLVSRYGEFILLKPRFNKSTMMLWLFPLFAIALIFILLLRIRR